MLKKYCLIFLLLFANNLMAVDNAQKSINDSTKYSKFNIHAGAGIFNGIRAGIDYRFSEHLSISVDYGKPIWLLLFGGIPALFNGPYQGINASVNYHISNQLPYILSISISKMKIHKYDIIREDYYVFQNFGWLFKLNHNQSLQLRTGPGIIISYENGKYRNWVVRPNLDIILNIHF